MKRSTVAINQAKRWLIDNGLTDKEIATQSEKLLKLLNQIKKCNFITKYLKFVSLCFFVEYDIWEEEWHEVHFVYKSKSKNQSIWILLYGNGEYELITSDKRLLANQREKRYNYKLDQFRKFYKQ